VRRGADHIFGCMGLEDSRPGHPGFDGIGPGGRTMYKDPGCTEAGCESVQVSWGVHACHFWQILSLITLNEGVGFS
jgi:hypothetical protein